MTTEESDERARLRDFMVGVLQTWGDGYTEFYPDGEQRKVVIENHLEDGIDVEVRTLSLATSEADRKYRVRVSVEEIR